MLEMFENNEITLDEFELFTTTWFRENLENKGDSNEKN